MSGNDFSYECEDGELFSMEDYSMDMMYRSMDVARPTQVVFHTPQAHKSISGPIVQQLDQPKQSFVFVPSSSCPPAPRCLPVSKFTVAGELTCLVQKITDHLQNQEDFDVCFVENEFMWRGKYLSGSSCFEVAINLYYDASTKLFTIAVRKMKNDCAPNGNFCVFYTALRNAISGGCSAPRIPLSKSHGALPYACGASSSGAGLTKEEFIEGIQPIFSMAHSPCQENRVQSAKMLCDVSTKQAHFLELPVFKNECVYALAGMIRDECEEVRQYAVVAVAAFAELPLYQEAFIASCVVPALFGLVENSPEPATGFETAQVRRQAALVLALLSKTHPYSVRACMDHQGCDVSHWMARAATLHDTRTREAALAVKSALEDVSVENRVIDHTGFSDDFNGLECGFA